MKHTLRRLVLANADHPLLSRCFRGVYAGVVFGFSLWARLHPQVVALYVRGSFARGDYLPGRSDLDFVIVLRAREHDRARFSFLRRFRAAIRAVRRILPMLGEVEILAQPHFSSWRAQVIDRRQMRPVSGPCLAEESRPDQVEELTQALSDFVYLFLPNLSHWSCLELQRLAAKILRYCGVDSVSLSECPWELAAQVLQAILSAVQCVPWPSDFSPWNLEQRPRREELPGWLGPWSDHLDGVVWSPYERGECIVVMKERTPREATRDLIHCMHQNLSRPVLLDRPTFRFYLNFVSPLQGISLVADRVVWGLDPVCDFVRQEGCFRRGMIRSAALVLSHVQTHEIAPEQNQQVLLGWFLRVKRYLALESYFHDILAHYEKADPDLYALIQSCLKNPDPSRDISLYRRISDDLNRALSIPRPNPGASAPYARGK